MRRKKPWERVKIKGVFSEEDAAEIMTQMFSALEYLHERHFMHRNIAAENIFFVSENGLEIKIMDFGNACRMDMDGKASGECGNTHYMAREMFKGSYTEKADMWSCGVMLYAIITGKMPYNEKDKDYIIEEIVKNPFSVDMSSIDIKSDTLVDLLQKLLRVKESERISASDALKHPWIVFHQNRKTLENTQPEKAAIMELSSSSSEKETETKESEEVFDSTSSDMFGLLNESLDDFKCTQKRKDNAILMLKKLYSEKNRNDSLELKSDEDNEFNSTVVTPSIIGEILNKLKGHLTTFDKVVAISVKGLTWRGFLKCIEDIQVE
jgi:serine/threonine protein kinase